MEIKWGYQAYLVLHWFGCAWLSTTILWDIIGLQMKKYLKFSIKSLSLIGSPFPEGKSY